MFPAPVLGGNSGASKARTQAAIEGPRYVGLMIVVPHIDLSP